MVRTSAVLLVILSLGFALSYCQSTPKPQLVSTAEYELKGTENFLRFLDKETGIGVYVSEVGVSCLQLQKPAVRLENLTDRLFPNIREKFGRTIDREHGVVIYYSCAALDYRTCDSAAIRYAK